MPSQPGTRGGPDRSDAAVTGPDVRTDERTPIVADEQPASATRTRAGAVRNHEAEPEACLAEAADRTWTIAQIAAEFDVTHRTVRHYEEIGLIAPERRGMQRIYRRREKIRLALILRGKRLGFPLEEIRTIVDMYDDIPGEAGQLRYVLRQVGERRADLEQRRRDLDDLFGELEEFERRCREDLAAME